MPLLPITSPSTILKCKELPLRSSDVFICSYPKSGTTWTQQIVLSLILADKRYESATSTADNTDDKADTTDDNIYNDDIKQVEEYNHVSDYAPFYEIDAHWESNTNQLTQQVRANHTKLGRRVFNTHLRWDMLPKFAENDNGNVTIESTSIKEDKQNLLRPTTGKFIYITRSQSDVVTSFYYHLSNQKEGTYTQGYTQFVVDWMDGKIAFGNSLHHLLSFVDGFVDNEYRSTLSEAVTSRLAEDDTQTRRHEQPLLLLSYEALKHNLQLEVQRIISFLNLKHIPTHILENELLPSFTFASMKSNSSKFQPKSVTWLNNYQFLRKGIVGDGRELMLTTKVYDEKKGREVSLLEMFHDWVKDEGYRECIKKLVECGKLEKKIGDQFLALVD